MKILRKITILFGLIALFVLPGKAIVAQAGNQYILYHHTPPESGSIYYFSTEFKNYLSANGYWGIVPYSELSSKDGFHILSSYNTVASITFYPAQNIAFGTGDLGSLCTLVSVAKPTAIVENITSSITLGGEVEWRSKDVGVSVAVAGATHITSSTNYILTFSGGGDVKTTEQSLEEISKILENWPEEFKV